MWQFGWREWLRRRRAAGRGRRSRPASGAVTRRPRLEALEDRFVPTTLHWTGLAPAPGMSVGQDPNWSDPQNWRELAAPQNNDDLVFPAGAAQTTNTDNIANLVINSLTFSGPGYTINGASGVTLTLNGPVNDMLTGSGNANNNVQVPLTLGASTVTVTVTDGQQTLALNGPITGAGGLTKTGPGQLDFGSFNGSGSNTYSGPTQVVGGLLTLDKPTAVTGPLILGNDTGAPASDLVLMTVDNATDFRTPVTVNGDGLLAVGEDGSDSQLSAFAGATSNDMIGSLTLHGGTVSIAMPQSTSGSSGLSSLTLNGDVTTTASTATATIKGGGTLVLGTSTVTFNVADGPADPDLAVTAPVSDLGEGDGVAKAGAGRMVLSGNNSYTAGTDITAGELNVQSNTALGSGSAAVTTGAALELQPMSSQGPNGQPGFGFLSLANNLTLNGPGVGGTGALRTISGFDTLTGNITLQTDSTIGTDAGSFLQIGFRFGGSDTASTGGGTITGAGGLTKVGLGFLTLSGSTANSYAGPTVVDAGFVALGKPSGIVAVPTNLTIGNATGPSSTSGSSGSSSSSGSSGGPGSISSPRTTVFLQTDEQIADSARVTIASDGILNINVASETIGSLTGSGLVQFGSGSSTSGSGSSTSSMSGPPPSGTLRVGADNTSTTFAGALAGSTGNFIKIGGGVLVLGGTSSFGGTTSVSGGKLQVDGSLAGSATVVNAGGILGGAGTVGPLTANAGGVVAPGDSPGILTAHGGATLNAGSVLFIQVNGVTAGSGYAQLNVLGPVALNGATLQLGFGAIPPRGADLIVIANNGSGPVSGAFAGMPEDALLRHGSSTFFDLSYAGGRGHDVDLLTQSRDDVFVRALFADFNAPSTRATRAPFEGRAASGESRLTVARDFLVSPLRRLGEVNLFYATFGMPDDGQKGRYVKELLAGVPAGQVLINFLTSPSFRRLHRNNQTFLRQLFAGLLGHAPGARDRLGGHTLAFYVQELNSRAVSRAQLVRDLLSSDEVYMAAVMENFRTFLGTTPTPAQVQTVAGQLLIGGLDPDTLSESIVAQESYVDFFLVRGAAGKVPGVVIVNV